MIEIRIIRNLALMELNLTKNIFKTTVNHFMCVCVCINSMDYIKLILVEQHFHSNHHNFNRDARLTIIERIEQVTNIKPMTEN